MRDPRAVVNSRRSTVGWCSDWYPDCSDPEILCKDMQDDFKTALYFKKYFPNNFHILRYEDLASDPFAKTKKLMHALGLAHHAKVRTYLELHTTQEVDLPWSTSRNTKKR